MVALLLLYYCLHLSLSPSMATSTSTMGYLTPCPFCKVPYKGLGNHLKHCGQRDGRDYNQYLAPKTLKKSQPRKKTKCPKCSKSFWRLDTHLRRSAVCRSILPSPSRTVNVESGAVSIPVNDSVKQLAEVAILLASQDLNSAEVAPGVTTNTTQLPPSPEVKCHLLVPQTTEGWEAANQHFINILLVPAVLNASTLTEKYSILTDGVYSYFQSSCGTKPIRKQKKQ